MSGPFISTLSQAICILDVLIVEAIMMWLLQLIGLETLAMEAWNGKGINSRKRPVICDDLMTVAICNWQVHPVLYQYLSQNILARILES